MDTLKKISIKTSTIKRYSKDIGYYKMELEQLQAKHQQLLTEPETCPHVLRKQEEVIQETTAMIPDCEGRLEAARADLQEYLNAHLEQFDDLSISSSDIFKEAQAILTK